MNEIGNLFTTLSNKLGDLFIKIFSFDLKVSNMDNFINIGVKITLYGVIFYLMICSIKYLIYYIHDLRLRKSGALLKILPKDSTDIKETEKLIKNLHSMLLNTKWRKYLYGRQYISFEIVAIKGKINFYIWVPRDMKDRIIDRIYETYPEIAISDEDEYIENIKNLKNLSYYTANLSLGFHHTLRIKKRQEVIGSIFSAMRELDKNEFAAVQILCRPMDNKWQIEGKRELARFEREGKRPGEKLSWGNKVSNGVGSILNEVESELRGSKKLVVKNNIVTNKKTKSERNEIVVASEKLSEPGLETVIRIVAAGKFRKANTARVKAIVAAFNELDAENRFKRDYIPSHKYIMSKFIKRKMDLRDGKNILTPPELSSMFIRLPSSEYIEDYKEIERLVIKEFDIPKDCVESGKGYVFAENIYRGNRRRIEIKPKDLVRHFVAQGKTGSGKSEWFKTLFMEVISNKYDEDGKIIKKGGGAMVLEPHGKLADELLEIIPEDRWDDVIVVDPYSDHPLGMNFCIIPESLNGELSPELVKQKTIEEALEIIKRKFQDIWSDKNEYFIENALKTIIETQDTMVELPRLFNDKKFRNKTIPKIKDPAVKKFWKDKFNENKNGDISSSVESTAQSVEYKLDKFIRSPELKRIFGQHECIDFKKVLDENKILIFKFDKKKMSRDKIEFIGGIAIKLIIVAAFNRNKEMWDEPFLVGIDEAQNFIGESIKDILYELRKYGVALGLLHQELKQLNKVPNLVDAIYNNVGTSITFTTGDTDASFFAKKYGPRVDAADLNNLPSRYGYCKLLVNGATSNTFNIYSIDSPKVSEEMGKKAVESIYKNNSKGRLTAEEIDQMIADRYEDSEEIDIENQAFAIEIDSDFENEEEYSKELNDNEDNKNKVKNRYW
ncbi:helicase HerA domain-containing protein [Clostridium tertium]|uniref:helicase HerA domain-containing protein n=1 Tax=Clostridium tertium TaxID=1559 RepID=UPI000BE23ECC|nr:DUF87 domain-containing protein [Clostridium tertium]